MINNAIDQIMSKKRCLKGIKDIASTASKWENDYKLLSLIKTNKKLIDKINQSDEACDTILDEVNNVNYVCINNFDFFFDAPIIMLSRYEVELYKAIIDDSCAVSVSAVYSRDDNNSYKMYDIYINYQSNNDTNPILRVKLEETSIIIDQVYHNCIFGYLELEPFEKEKIGSLHIDPVLYSNNPDFNFVFSLKIEKYAESIKKIKNKIKDELIAQIDSAIDDMII